MTFRGDNSMTFLCGHEKTPENTRWHLRKYTLCRICDNAKSRARYHRNREQRAAKALAYYYRRKRGEERIIFG